MTFNFLGLGYLPPVLVPSFERGSSPKTSDRIQTLSFIVKSSVQKITSSALLTAKDCLQVENDRWPTRIDRDIEPVRTISSHTLFLWLLELKQKHLMGAL